MPEQAENQAKVEQVMGQFRNGSITRDQARQKLINELRMTPDKADQQLGSQPQSQSHQQR
jgi:hypothetical protein